MNAGIGRSTTSSTIRSCSESQQKPGHHFHPCISQRTQECYSVKMAAGSRALTAEEISRNIETHRNITISIENNSDFSLTSPRIYTFSGYNVDPPQPTINAKTTAVCSFSKTSYTARGAVGVLTYNVINNNDAVEHIAMMFSVPYDYNLYTNLFAIGSFSVGTSCDNALYNRMYQERVEGFIRRQATEGIIEFTGKAVEIKATMSPAGRSIMKVEVWNKPLCA